MQRMSWYGISSGRSTEMAEAMSTKFFVVVCYSRGAGTYGDKGTCPDHILEKRLKNVVFLNIVPTKFKTKLFFVPSIFKYVPAPLFRD